MAEPGIALGVLAAALADSPELGGLEAHYFSERGAWRLVAARTDGRATWCEVSPAGAACHDVAATELTEGAAFSDSPGELGPPPSWVGALVAALVATPDDASGPRVDDVAVTSTNGEFTGRGLVIGRLDDDDAWLAVRDGLGWLVTAEPFDPYVRSVSLQGAPADAAGAAGGPALAVTALVVHPGGSGGFAVTGETVVLLRDPPWLREGARLVWGSYHLSRHGPYCQDTGAPPIALRATFLESGVDFAVEGLAYPFTHSLWQCEAPDTKALAGAWRIEAAGFVRQEK